MPRSPGRLRAISVVLALGALVASSARAGGFSVSEQGTLPMGLSNAFAAQADDPSAMFFNVGGLAQLDERQFQLGTTLIFLGNTEFRGEFPYPGPGVTAEMEQNLVTPTHFYWVEPLNSKLVFGLAVNSPFGLITEWDGDFPGRFISERAELRTFDINPSLGWRAGERLNIGFGVAVRLSEIDLTQRLAALNPFTFRAEEVARVELESDLEYGLGWNVGLLHRPTERLSWGLWYRSRVEIDYDGHGRLTQTETGNPAFDDVVRDNLPFDRDLPISTAHEFPDTAGVALAYAVAENWVVEGDLNWTGWSAFDEVRIRFTEQPFEDEQDNERVIDADWGDAWNVRLGARWARGSGGEWRFGAYFDQTPQPEETVGPLLPDADRIGASFGYGRQFGRLSTDFAVMYIALDERTTTTNTENFNGTYETRIALLGVTLGW